MKNCKLLIGLVILFSNISIFAHSHGGGDSGSSGSSVSNVQNGPINVRGFNAEEIDFFYTQIPESMLTDQEREEWMRHELDRRFGHLSAQANETRRLNAESYLADVKYEFVSGGAFIINAAGAVVGFIATAPEAAIIASISLGSNALNAAVGSLSEDYDTAISYYDRLIKAGYSAANRAFWDTVSSDFIKGKNLSQAWDAFANYMAGQLHDNVSLTDLADATEGGSDAK